MTPSAIFDKSRRNSLFQLAACGIGQATGAVILASALSRALQSGLTAPNMGWMVMGGLLTATAMLGERWAGEVLAQSLVSDIRQQLFDKLVANKGSANEARWLNPLVGDLSAIRNWAARGPVRLATSALALVSTLLLFTCQMPMLAMAGLPLLATVLLLVPIGLRLSRVVRQQRSARGGMTQFIIRRARIEASGKVRRNRHGLQSMRNRSAILAGLAIKRAVHVGMLEAVSVCGTVVSAISLAYLAANQTIAPADVTAAVTLTGFMSTRLIEVARASHAAIGGNIAFARISKVLANNDFHSPSPHNAFNRNDDHD